MLPVLAVAVPLGVFLVVYLANAGHGFLLDDFEWVLRSRVRSAADAAELFSGSGGFYRPVTAITFTLNEWMFGPRPLGYGLTNVALALACAAAIAWLARGFGLSRGASALAGLVWLMNMHFTRTAILWICGRTALVVALCAALCAAWLVRGRLWAAAAGLALALLAKEEAVLLPFVLAAWLLAKGAPGTSPPVTARRWVTVSGIVLVLYFAARGLTPAMTPWTAPDYYRFTFEPAAILRNAGEYADRTATMAALAALVAFAFLGRPRPLLDEPARAAIRCGVIWLVGALGLACLLPVRSDLYAAVPAVGACLAAAAVVDRLWQAAAPARRRRALAAALIVPLLLAPVYWQRTQRLARLASFSEAALDDLETHTGTLPDGARVLIDDAQPVPGVRTPTMGAAFGAQLNDAYELRTGRRLDLAMSADAPLEEGPASAPVALRLAVRDGRLTPVRSPAR